MHSKISNLLFKFQDQKKYKIRRDYQELLELTVIFLGGNIPNGNRFRQPGDLSHARWMAKAIYSIEIYMFREQFRLTDRGIRGLREFCIFLIKDTLNNGLQQLTR